MSTTDSGPDPGPSSVAENAAPGKEPRTLAPGGRHRVLVVDDNQDGAESMTFLLRAMGQDATMALDGEQALELAVSFQPDVVLMDIGLPRLNGYDAGRRIREMPGGDRVVLVALTGWGQDDDRRQSREAGFDHHWVKPVDLQVLRELLGVRG